ncbi:MAG TPA: hypothetical protein VK023_08555 [Sphingobacterium bovisgrunnientis]|jgi:hypothetical protein|nr:hypothetical protein [Sphingobacterium bovisgrunnientis]
MENFIIVLIAIGGLIYNVYKNYQKEMEKSKSRRPNVRPQPTPSPPIQQTIEKVKRQETYTAPFERTYQEEIPAEVIAAQQRRRQNQIKNPLPTLRIEEKQTEKNVVDFDLRQAVIQAAILERPYK